MDLAAVCKKNWVPACAGMTWPEIGELMRDYSLAKLRCFASSRVCVNMQNMFGKEPQIRTDNHGWLYEASSTYP